jgi:hypothetical protein
MDSSDRIDSIDIISTYFPPLLHLCLVFSQVIHTPLRKVVRPPEGHLGLEIHNLFQSTKNQLTHRHISLHLLLTLSPVESWKLYVH